MASGGRKLPTEALQVDEFVARPPTRLARGDGATFAALRGGAARAVAQERHARRCEAWLETMTVGQSRPELPIWVDGALLLALELEPSIEQAWDDLPIA